MRRLTPPVLVDNISHDPILQLLCQPSFDTITSWGVYVQNAAAPLDQQAYFATRMAWDQNHEREKFEAILPGLATLRQRLQPRVEPSVSRHAVTLDTITMQPLLASIEALQIPVKAVQPKIGCDGTVYEMSVGGFWASLTLRWWEQSPPDWGDVGKIAEKLLEHMEAKHQQH